MLFDSSPVVSTKPEISNVGAESERSPSSSKSPATKDENTTQDDTSSSSSGSSSSSSSSQSRTPQASRPIKRRKIAAVSSSSGSGSFRRKVSSQSSLDRWVKKSPSKGDSLESLPVGRSPLATRSPRQDAQKPLLSKSPRKDSDSVPPITRHTPQEKDVASRLLHQVEDLTLSERRSTSSSSLSADEPEVTRRSPRFVLKPSSKPPAFVSYTSKKGKSKSPTPNQRPSSGSSTSSSRSSSRRQRTTQTTPTPARAPARAPATATRHAPPSKSTKEKRKPPGTEGDEMDLTVSLPTPAADDDGNDSSDSDRPTAPGVYEVERVMNKRTVNNSVQYLLKWKGMQ